jgi:hypothetical protein
MKVKHRKYIDCYNKLTSGITIGGSSTCGEADFLFSRDVEAEAQGAMMMLSSICLPEVKGKSMSLLCHWSEQIYPTSESKDEEAKHVWLAKYRLVQLR